MKKKFNWRDIISEVLRITMIVQLGTYGLMHQLNELPQNKTINIMLGLTALAVFLVGLWFPYLIPNSPKEDDDMEKLEKDRKIGFAIIIVATVAAVAIFIMQVITGSLIPFA